MNRQQIEQSAIARANAVYCGDHTALCRVLGGYLMYVDTRDTSIAPHMMMSGYWESWITKAIADYIKPGMICADVGACVGYFTLVMADRVGPHGHVYCFEPNPRQMGLIKRTLDINGLSNRVTLVQKATSDETTTVKLQMPEEHPINGTIVGAPITIYEDEKLIDIEVETVRMDDVIEGRLDFLKADIEGAEPRMFKGMPKLWESNKQLAMCVEYVPAHYHGDALPEQFVEAGARLGWVTDEGTINAYGLGTGAAGDPARIWMLWVTHK